MKVAEKNRIGLDVSAPRVVGMGAPRVYAAHRLSRSDEKHDARGLVVAIALCLCCWAALGYFLLV